MEPKKLTRAPRARRATDVSACASEVSARLTSISAFRIIRPSLAALPQADRRTNGDSGKEPFDVEPGDVTGIERAPRSGQGRCDPRRHQAALRRTQRRRQPDREWAGETWRQARRQSRDHAAEHAALPNLLLWHPQDRRGGRSDECAVQAPRGRVSPGR